MAFVLIEVCRGRKEDIATFELASRAVEVARALCIHSMTMTDLRLDYEVISFYGEEIYKTNIEEFDRTNLEKIYDKKLAASP